MPDLRLIEFASGKFCRDLHLIENFCATCGPIFQSLWADSSDKRSAARAQDIADFGQIQDAEMYEGEEMEVAYEQFELEELYGLLGLFGLVYIVSRIEDFFGAVFDAGGWSKPKGYGFNLNEYRQKIESNTGSSLSDSPASFDYIEEMVSARNDFIHRGGEMGNRYKENFPSPRFARQGKIVFTLSHVADATCLLKDFAAFIEAKCRPFSKPLRGKLE